MTARFRYLLNVVSDIGGSTSRFVIEPGISEIGSSTDASVVIQAVGVSRRHATLEVLADGGVIVSDLGSKNGTFLHGRRVERAVVPPGALLRFGEVEAQVLDRNEAKHSIAITGSSTEDRSGAVSTGSVRAEDPSTERVLLTDRVMGAVCELLRTLDRGGDCVEVMAAAMARKWLRSIPAVRVDFLHEAKSGSPAVIASAVVDREHVSEKPHLSVQVNGLVVEIWGRRADLIASLHRPVELALYALLGAVRDKASEGGGDGYSGIGGNIDSLNPGLRELCRRAGKVARGEIPVLILGPSGAGKEVLARWMHERSRRVNGPFVAINCTALSRELLEAELFGIEKGVATGVEERPGLIEQADGGTFLLDEIGDMPKETQAKMLRVLEDRGFFRVGGRELIRVDVRIMAATNRPVETLVADGSFREDLYHRIAAFIARVPALKDRSEDITLLAAEFFAEATATNRISSPGITREALAALVEYEWPGNIRELKNEIGKAVLLLESDEPLALEHLSAKVSGDSESEADPLSLAAAVRRAEKQAIQVALAAADGHPSRARELLCVGKTTYYAKLKQLGLRE